jgi:ubiquinone/menaquinone biosynthesis C-methylase UbiE
VKAVDEAAFLHRGFMPREVAREIMDDDVEDPRELDGNLRDIERANRWFGATREVLRFMDRNGARSVLDVGCGSADIPLALAGAARQSGRELRIACVDRSAQMLDIARGRAASFPAMTFAQAEGDALPFADGAFDVVTCSLMLHHCDPPEAVPVLRELRRVAARAALVADLRRSPAAYAGALLFAYGTSRNRLTHNDAPLSVRRAYTPREALALAQAAGWRRPQTRSLPFFRMLVFDE